MSVIHEPCPKCTSSDAFVRYDNGWGHCFSCGANVKLDDKEPVMKESTNEKKVFQGLPEVFKPFKQRGFTAEALKKYSVRVDDHDPNNIKVKYPLSDINNVHIGNKVREAGKNFHIEGTISEAGLFGRQAFSPGGKFITVVEGQDDAIAAFQMNGHKYPVVSVHSSSSALKDVERDFVYLNSFDNIIICFDNDEPGKKAAQKVASLPWPLGKLKILTLRKYKDANDYLINGEAGEFIKEWWAAPVHKPDGLKLGSDVWTDIIDRKESFSVPYPFPTLNKLLFGIRLSEAVVIAAPTGVGKTSFIKHIEHSLLTNSTLIEKGYGVGFLHFEEPIGDTALGLLSIHNSTPYHLPTVDRPVEELKKAYDAVLNNDRVVMWDHFGSNKIDVVLDKIRHMAVLGCKYIVVDHLSIIVSDQSGDERKQLDELSTKLKTLTMQLDIAVIAVAHMNREGQIRSSAGIEQLANAVIFLDRDKKEKNEWRRNITSVTVEKNRFCGYSGPAGYLFYDKNTARLSELDEQDTLLFENGGALGDDAIGF